MIPTFLLKGQKQNIPIKYTIEINMTDNDKITFGTYKGTAMANLPASYLIYLWESKNATPEVMEYIKVNLDAIKIEIKLYGK